MLELTEAAPPATAASESADVVILADDLGYFSKVTLEYVGATVSGPQDIQSVATGQTDVGGAFSGAVVKLAGAGSPITAVINYYGSDETSYQGLYVRKDSSIRGPKDLDGAKIAVNTLGAHAEAFVETWLTKAGLSAAEIEQVQLVVLPPNDTEEAIRRKQVDVGALGGILQDRALAQPDIRELVRELSDDSVADAIRILYGGSVKSGNVAQIMAQEDVDGALVGGASLDAEEFASICRYRDHVGTL